MNLSPATITVEDLVLGATDSDGVAWLFHNVEGWHGGPGVRREDTPRPNAHGSFPMAGKRSGRVVAVTGNVVAPTRALAGEAAGRLSSVLADGGFGELVIDDVDLGVLTATVQLAAEPLVAWNEPTRVQYMLELHAPDPLLYGPADTVSTGLPQDLGGLRFDLFTDGNGSPVQYLDFGQLGTTGRITVTNPGTAEARSLLEVTGSMPLGFELIETRTGRRLRYEAPVTASSTVTLDSATGRVRLDTADRGGALTRAEWWGVPARDKRGVPGQREVLFQSLSGYVADARLSVTTRPTYW